jgi:hypothetical protein
MVDYTQGRLRAGEVVTAHPEMPLREVARKAGVSVATARDVRKRIQRGADPLPPKLRLVGEGAGAGKEDERERQPEADGKAVDQLPSPRPRSVVFTSNDWSVVRPKLLRDPLLKYSASGRTLFRWYDTHAIDAQDLMAGVEAVQQGEVRRPEPHEVAVGVPQPWHDGPGLYGLGLRRVRCLGGRSGVADGFAVKNDDGVLNRVAPTGN